MVLRDSSKSQAGAVEQAPGPNFGRKLTKSLQKLKHLIFPSGPLLVPCMVVLWEVIFIFVEDRKSFGVWAAPGARETIQKYGGGDRSPPSGMVFGAAQTPKIGGFRPAQKLCIKSRIARRCPNHRGTTVV